MRYLSRSLERSSVPFVSGVGGVLDAREMQDPSQTVYNPNMFVALSKFVVANGTSSEVAAAFRNRPHKVDFALGFVRMDVLSPEDNASEFWLITYWASRAPGEHL